MRILTIQVSGSHGSRSSWTAKITFFLSLAMAIPSIQAIPSYQLQNTTTTPKTQASLAVSSMMKYYNQTTGLFGDSTVPWWLSGNALQSLLDYTSKTSSFQYLEVAKNTISIQKAPLSWWPEGNGDFRADSTDDTGWWALANLKIYELTGETEYLEIAKEDEEYMWSYRYNGTLEHCRGGGIIWDIPTQSYVNAISNELYLLLVASLHNNIYFFSGGEDRYYLDKAIQHWQWFKESGMINPESGLINDGLEEEGTNGTCVNNGGITWTYNQGVILGGLVELWKATGDVVYIQEARSIADAVLGSEELSPGGILTEPCETDPETCVPNGPAFKGIFVRYLSVLNSVCADRPYSAYLEAQVASAYANDRNSSDFYGLSWAGPFQDVDIASQTSAVSLLTAVF